MFLACAYPKCCIDILDPPSEDVSSVIEYCAKHIKAMIDQQYSKNISFYNKSPESVISKGRLRFVARFLVVQHNLMIRSRVEADSPGPSAKRQRLVTCLEDMLDANNAERLHYLIVYEEIFKKFGELLPSDIVDAIVQRVARLDVGTVRK